MNGEEAINLLHGMRADNLNLDDVYTKDKYEALGMAIEAIEQIGCLTGRPCEYCKNHVDGRRAAWDCAFDDVLSSSENPNKSEIMTGWIPVSERLPEEYCLFCDIDGDVFYGHIYDDRWWAEGQDDRIKNVIAWMPLPEPYKAEGSDT